MKIFFVSLGCDKNQLFYTLICKILCLRNQVFHRYTAVTTAHLRDDAVRTALVAALCDLQIRIMSAGCEHTARTGFRKRI